MTPYTIILRHALVKWPRTIFLLAILIIGGTGVSAFQAISEKAGETMERQLLSHGANIIILPKRHSFDISYGGLNLGNATIYQETLNIEESIKSILSIDLKSHIAAIAPKSLTLIHEGENLQPIALVGVDWEQEPQIKGYWTIEGSIPKKDLEVLAGANISNSLNLQIGQQIHLIEDISLTLTGIISPTGGDDDNVLLTSLRTVQQINGQINQANIIEVAALCSGCPISHITEQLQEALPSAQVTAVQKIAESRLAAVNVINTTAFHLSITILILAGITISISTFNSVNERKKEIGIMRAVGLSRKTIFKIFSSEAIILGSLAGFLAYPAGIILGNIILKKLAPEASISFNLISHALHILTLAFLAFLSTLIPAHKATTIDPSSTLSMP